MKKIIQKIAKLIFLGMAIIGLVIGLISMVISLFEKTNILTKDKLLAYTVSKNQVRDYNSYYYIEACIDNMLEALKRNEYDAIYKLYIKDYRKGVSKSDIISTLKDTFKVENGTNYVTHGIYKIDSNVQLAVININGQDVNVLFKLNERKGASYSFALIN